MEGQEKECAIPARHFRVNGKPCGLSVWRGGVVVRRLRPPFITTALHEMTGAGIRRTFGRVSPHTSLLLPSHRKVRSGAAAYLSGVPETEVRAIPGKFPF